MERGPTKVYSGSVRCKKHLIIGSAATVQLDALMSRAIALFDSAAGIVYTLPPANPGISIEFMVSVSVTSNNFKIITSAGTEFLTGGIVSDDTDSGDVATNFRANGTSHVALTMNGTTTGGLIGTRLRFTCLSTTLWMVEGVVNGSGTVATPFATS